MQGSALLGAMQELGVEPNEVKDVILTHLHFDHAEGMAAWPQRQDLRPPDRDRGALRPDRRRQLEIANLEVVDGEEGEIEPGLRWILRPGTATA